MSSNPAPWIGVDLDRTLATYNKGEYKTLGNEHIGEPIPAMVQRVNNWLDNGVNVKILTARVSSKTPADERDRFLAAWPEWSRKHFQGQVLDTTAEKDYAMEGLWDDRAVRVLPNYGLTLEDLIMNEISAYEHKVQAGHNRTEAIGTLIGRLRSYISSFSEGTLLGY